jgi:hypothetical protein
MTIHYRDRFVCALCNFLLNHVATPWYRDMVGGSIRYGLNAAAADSLAVSHPERKAST